MILCNQSFTLPFCLLSELFTPSSPLDRLQQFCVDELLRLPLLYHSSSKAKGKKYRTKNWVRMVNIFSDEFDDKNYLLFEPCQDGAG